jgi:hypothetical protein
MVYATPNNLDSLWLNSDILCNTFPSSIDVYTIIQ